MEILGDLAKILLPSVIMLYAMYATVQSFLKKELEKRLVDIKIKNNETILPIRLQAYERMCLFLERISPGNLVVRLNQPGMDALVFHQIILNEIREEFSHNMSQQLYMSENAWKAINAAREDVVMLVNHAASDLSQEAKSLDLARKILEMNVERNVDSINHALSVIKDEVRTVF